MKIPFNVDANTARLICRENVSKLDGAILELIGFTNCQNTDFIVQ